MTCFSWSYSYLLRLPGRDLDDDVDRLVGRALMGGGRRAPGGVDGAHDPHAVAVGVADHGVAGAPEGVVGLPAGPARPRRPALRQGRRPRRAGRP